MNKRYLLNRTSRKSVSRKEIKKQESVRVDREIRKTYKNETECVELNKVC